MKKKISVILILLIITCCNSEKTKSLPNIETYNLYKINSSKVHRSLDSLHITLHDDSFIYFPEYIKTKSDIFLFDNYETLKKEKFKGLKVNFIQMDRKEIYSEIYDENKLDSIYNKLNSNKYLNKYLHLIVNDFTPTELWNFRNLVKQASEKLNDKTKLTYLELIKRVSEKQLTEKNKSREYKRIKIIRDFLKESTITNFWDYNQEVSSETLQKKLDLILTE